MSPLQIVGLSLLLFVGTVGCVLYLRRYLRTKRRREAMNDFEKLRSTIESTFLPHASSSGKPRGLRWKQCDFTGPPTFAIDRASLELYAFVRVSILFEAEAGSDMEDVEAVANEKIGSALFIHREGAWKTEGKAVLNFEPHEVIAQWADMLEPFEE